MGGFHNKVSDRGIVKQILVIVGPGQPHDSHSLVLSGNEQQPSELWLNFPLGTGSFQFRTIDIQLDEMNLFLSRSTQNANQQLA